jgi:DNA-binding GntR family transcriptional regulator
VETKTTQIMAKDTGSTLEEQAMKTLLEWLAHGHAKPGQALPLREFSTKLGISRTPLRAAAGRLHEQGLLDYDSRHGFTVTVPTKADLIEFFDLREMTELHGAGRVIGARIPIPQELDRVVEEAADIAPKIVDDPPLHSRFWRLDVRFHRLLLSLADNGRLLALWDQLLANVRVYQFGKTMPLSKTRFTKTVAEHKAILAAYKAYDETEARHLLSEHIRRIRDVTIATALEQLETADEPDWLSHLAPPEDSDR